MAICIALFENEHLDWDAANDMEDSAELSLDDVDEELLLDDESSLGYELTVSNFMDVVDDCVETVLETLRAGDKIIATALLHGHKKKTIADCYNVTMKKIMQVETAFVECLSETLSIEISKEVSFDMIRTYLGEKKKYRTEINQKWEQWKGYREKVAEEKERKEIEKLKKELNIGKEEKKL
jgi:hypothetical protein